MNNKDKDSLMSLVKFPIMGYDEDAYRALPATERVVLAAAHFCDVLKVREELGHNKGKFVNVFLKLVGLSPGYAWCAAFISACLDVAGVSVGPKVGRAAVISWERWAVKNKVDFPGMWATRGDFVYLLNEDGTGHIEVVIHGLSESEGDEVLSIDTIGGNTNSAGSREGDSVQRKARLVSKKWRVIKWKNLLQR
jgi:hypothetical protein